ncbi:hypothetical protein [Scleromatobacter humisilvae]|uniref:Uncharacterized protein n=1 Tax=Scleromatobacter humisilvae TaxID=2897159 RepID=A0A9X1YLW9_9BURK|nr:hypothetical protein [Scleromatobacter humisilvae]MCK9684111.1 hypothetical protein [Scleromatobacter humisilvae]
MSYKAKYTSLAWSDALTAAIYFDRVIPTNIPDVTMRGPDDPVYYEVLKEILPETLVDPSTKTGLSQSIITYVAYFYLTFPAAGGVYSLAGGETLEQRRDSRMPEFLKAFGALVESSRMNDFSVYGAPLSVPQETDSADPCLILSNLDLIDTTKLSWRQVLELRRDVDAVERLRNLRRMVYKDYSGKSEAYIREDLEFRISEYESATRLWGLPLQKGVLEIAMTGDALMAMGAATALTLFGAPIAAAAAAGGAIAIGKAALAIAQRKRDIDLERRRNPVAYLVKLQQMAGDVA